MAHTILINNDNSMTTTHRERIMQRTTNIDSVWFLVEPEYKGYDMSQFTAYIEYVLPASKKYKTEVLTNIDDYEDHLRYTLDIDTDITAEPGDVEFQISFVYADLDEDGNSIQRVRKANGASLIIVPIKAWSEVIPDAALSAIDQRLIVVNSQLKALEDTAEQIYTTKADNLKYDISSAELQLLAGDTPIGDAVELDSKVEFGYDDSSDDPVVPSGDDVVEF